jgi:dTDP-4-amino-4,6-dideoxygalactose transaminase
MTLNSTSNASARPFVGGEATKRMELNFEPLLENRLVRLTDSCSSALEVAVRVLNLGPSDTILIPSYTFGSAVAPFVKAGCRIKWVDSAVDLPAATLNEYKQAWVEDATVVMTMPYAGHRIDSKKITEWAHCLGMKVVEDAAHGFGAGEHGLPFGSFGDVAAWSFHATKNLSCGEGGALVFKPDDLDGVNLWLDKGVDKQLFVEGRVHSYSWQVPAGKHAMSNLHAQLLEKQWALFGKTNAQRKSQWQGWYERTERGEKDGLWTRPPVDGGDAAHLYWLKTTAEGRRRLERKAMQNDIGGVAPHYQPLHQSAFGRTLDDTKCEHAEMWGNRLLRLPMMNEKTWQKVQDSLLS